VSDLLSAAADALRIPESLVERSAAARAEANGTSADDILTAWAGGASVASAPSAKALEPAFAAADPIAPPADTAAAVTVATIEIPQAPAVDASPEPEPVEPVTPVPLRLRIRNATRVGAWAGASLGLVGFLIATAFWTGNTSVTGEGPYNPVIVTNTTGVVIGAALVSILFGAIVAGLSRSATSWANPGMRLSTSPSATIWMGALIGLVLGVVAGALLTAGAGTVVEGEEGLTQLPVLATLSIMLIGGAILGGLTAALTQAVAVPVAIEEGAGQEIEEVKSRLGGALAVPVAGMLILLLLVLPFAWALFRSSELAAWGAPVVAVLAAGGILAFASLAGSRPNVRVSLGEAMVAIIGIGTVLVVILAVLFAQGGEEPHDETGPAETAIVYVVNW
jgi:MFS family permease